MTIQKTHSDLCPNRWDGQPYHSLNYDLKHRFGEPLYKIALNGGFTCPNRDGTLDHRGCIFCSRGGSGDFAGNPRLSISEQFEYGKNMLSGKYSGSRYIAYFQAFTNTYASVETLDQLYSSVIDRPDVAILSIATRPDCLTPEIIALLKRLNTIKPVWVELGLQTIHPDTIEFIRRGYPQSVFESAVHQLHDAGIEIIVHTILGLPGETDADILDTHRYLASLPVQGIKLQLLHVLKDTDLADYYHTHPFRILSLETYAHLVVRCIELLPPDMVIHRITGDGPKDLLIAPLWSGHKRYVLNTIRHEFKALHTWQGRCYQDSL